MLRKLRSLISNGSLPLQSVVVLSAALTLVATSVMAQRTTVEKNGLAGTIETDYDAAGKTTEMRTLGTDGKLRQKVQYENLSGHYSPDQTDSTYWQNGKTRKVVRKTYDESTNFTGEFIQIYDESGEQIAGHKLTHDPWTGTYRCSEWNTAGQNYLDIPCPSGEEEGGGNSAPKKFTYDEVMKHLELARKNALVEKEFGRLQAAGPAHLPTTVLREVGILLPARVHAGELISGTVVENPDAYKNMPEVTVMRVAGPFESSGQVSPLAGWLFETPGEEPRRADGPVVFVAPRNGSELKVTFREARNSAHTVSKTLEFPLPLTTVLASPELAKTSRSATPFQAAAFCMKGELCVVTGSFNGDSSKTFAAFEDRPATIAAETPDAVYLTIPEMTGPGSQPLLIAEGSKVIAFPVVVGEFFVRNNNSEMQPSESLITFPTLEGPEDITDATWRKFSASNLERARQLIPGFDPRGSQCTSRETDDAVEKREAEETDDDQRKRDHKVEEKEETEDGKILIVIKNLAPEQTSLHGSKNETVVFCLSDEAFQRGAFKYDLRVDARKVGKINAVGYVISFLAPVAGQEFSAKAVR